MKNATETLAPLADFATAYAAENLPLVSVSTGQGTLRFNSTIAQGWSKDESIAQLREIKKAVVRFYRENASAFGGRKISHSRNRGSRIWNLCLAGRDFDGFASGIEIELTEDEKTARLLGCAY